MNVKAKLKNRVVKVKMMFKNPMVGREEALKKEVKPQFITHIVATIENEVVYEISTGPFVSANPLFKFNLPADTKGKKLTITAIDNQGKKETKTVKIK